MEQNEDSPWQYKPDGKAPAPDDTTPEAGSKASHRPAQPAGVAWQGVEFIEHPHGSSWYGGLVLITAGLTALVYLMTKDFIATGIMPILGIILGIFAKQKPSNVQYEISDSGLKLNDKNYAYSLFKSFSVLQEGNFNSVNLFPLKRFMPPVSAYFDPADQQKIINALGEYLPYEERKMDGIDRLSRRLRL